MKKVVLFIITVLFMLNIAGCNNKTSTNTSSKPKVTEVSLKTVSVKLYDFGTIKIHAYATHDAMGDESYLVKSDKALVLLESPAFNDNLDEWSAYIKKIGKPVEGALLAYHPNGIKRYGNVTVYTTQNALTNWSSGGAISALNDNFIKTFGNKFDVICLLMLS